MVKPIGKTQVYEAVYDSMIDSIESGAWPIGERIPGEIELAENYQVSRNSVRTAIKVLVSYDILNCKPGIGTFVTDNAIDEIHNRRLLSMLQDTHYEREIMEVRGLLDKEIAYLAAIKRTDDDIKKLEECLANLEEAGQKQDNENMVYWGARFHEILAEATGNTFMATVYKSLKTQFDNNRMWYLEHMGPTDIYEANKASDRHIFEAVRDRNADKARELMAQHLDIREHGYTELSGKNNDVNTVKTKRKNDGIKARQVY